MEIHRQNIEITTEFIKLDQLLKFAGIADTGVIAKEMIWDEIISVNGEICTMRGKKIHPQDVVLAEFEDEIFEITVVSNES